jgi:hypothetical protein
MNRLKFVDMSPERQLDVLVAHFEVTDGCWPWTGFRNPAGYGIYARLRAHRLVYEASGLVIPDGLVLDHLCGVRHCVNPDHLEPVTRGENSRRGARPRDVCKNGHARTDDNTYITPVGARQCRICQRANWRRTSAKRRGAA